MKYETISFRIFFIITVSLLSIVITSAVTWVVSKQYKQATIHSFIHYTETVAHDLSLMASEYIILENYGSMQDYLSSYKDRPHIDSIAILSLSGKILAASRAELWGETFDIENMDGTYTASSDFDFNSWTMQYQYPIDFSGTTIGWCRIDVNIDQLKINLQTLQKKAVFLGGTVWLLAVALAFFAASFINRSLQSLMAVAQGVAVGDFERRAVVQGPREIFQLAVAFNTMAAAITKREEQLKRSERKFRTLVEEISDWIWEVDEHGVYTYVSPASDRMLGYKEEEMIGKTPFDFMSTDEAQRVSRIFARYVEGKSGFTNLINIQLHKNGRLVTLSTAGQPVIDEAGQLTGYRGVDRDISQEKKAEEELLKMKKMESIGVLAGGIAHDFNNLLSGILGNIELAAQRSEQDSETATLLDNALKATMRASKLTRQLLTFAKGGAPVKEHASLPQLIVESADFVIHGSKVKCEYHFQDGLWKAEVDPGQIGQVIQNIIINARQAMPDGGTIAVYCDNIEDAAQEARLDRNRGDYIRIRIKDSGHGMPWEMAERIFDPYFTTREEGSGLGLAVCYSIVNKHGGFILVDSLPGKGTTFTLYLPAAPLARKESVTEKTEPIETKKAARIMIMDDEQMIRDVIKAQLSALGHDTIMAGDGVEAIELYQEMEASNTPIDLVIMDLTIPGGMGGQEAAEKLLQVDPDAKIIVASGYSEDPVMASYEEYGFCATLAKPIDLTELRNAISSVMAQSVLAA